VFRSLGEEERVLKRKKNELEIMQCFGRRRL
jgi:hypothetical protein